MLCVRSQAVCTFFPARYGKNVVTFQYESARIYLFVMSLLRVRLLLWLQIKPSFGQQKSASAMKCADWSTADSTSIDFNPESRMMLLPDEGSAFALSQERVKILLSVFDLSCEFC